MGLYVVPRSGLEPATFESALFSCCCLHFANHRFTVLASVLVQVLLICGQHECASQPFFHGVRKNCTSLHEVFKFPVGSFVLSLPAVLPKDRYSKKGGGGEFRSFSPVQGEVTVRVIRICVATTPSVICSHSSGVPTCATTVTNA